MSRSRRPVIKRRRRLPSSSVRAQAASPGFDPLKVIHQCLHLGLGARDLIQLIEQVLKGTHARLNGMDGKPRHPDKTFCEQCWKSGGDLC